MLKKEITIYESDNYKIDATYYTCQNASNGLMIYLHGGGLIFGSKDDLPKEYISILVEKFDLLSVNYRLVPESTLADILKDLKHINDYIKSNFSVDVYVMGRSAGGYLSYLYSKHFDVKGLFILYGYFNFDHNDFSRIPADQKKLSGILNESIEKQNVETNVVTEKMPNPRYLLYLYYRNKNIWRKKLGVDLDDDTYYLSDENLLQLPRTFIAHTINDPDVPYYYAKHASMIIPECRLITLEGNLHDFDNIIKDENLNIYKEAIEYLTK
ncbi:alpha/beta hydrolase [Phocicoccus pinnipedialis]|uniref:Alpha/beta hydrolase fold protein n=1 Tax=Phocicoccus pinnipedialis TaxID=110845 RepID=A0A6V7RG68_9BACL|nr:alpha/beta hydrolase [Jeotgalicoccus pinnipedialis]MBP1939161.1 acetyl esterase/lipase [Jeotgalicoccus pinnipedialis]CAD2076520.1 alpha/beta hydrolase fold protein [Jeotgalicoccus pinnipedialis]